MQSINPTNKHSIVYILVCQTYNDNSFSNTKSFLYTCGHAHYFKEHKETFYKFKLILSKLQCVTQISMPLGRQIKTIACKTCVTTFDM